MLVILAATRFNLTRDVDTIIFLFTTALYSCQYQASYFTFSIFVCDLFPIPQKASSSFLQPLIVFIVLFRNTIQILFSHYIVTSSRLPGCFTTHSPWHVTTSRSSRTFLTRHGLLMVHYASLQIFSTLKWLFCNHQAGFCTCLVLVGILSSSCIFVEGYYFQMLYSVFWCNAMLIKLTVHFWYAFVLSSVYAVLGVYPSFYNWEHQTLFYIQECNYVMITKPFFWFEWSSKKHESSLFLLNT